MEPKTKKKYTVNMDISKVEKAKELLGSDKSLGELFDDVLTKIIDINENGGEKIELDSSKVFDFNSLQDTVNKQNHTLIKMVNKFSKVLERKDDPLFDFLVEGYWSLIKFDSRITTKSDYKTYARGDIVETNSSKLYLVVDTFKSNKIKLIQLPLHPESKKFGVDLNTEISNDNVKGYDVISLLWRK